MSARRAAVTLPDDLPLRVEQALAAANADATLNQHAADHLAARLTTQPMNDETGRANLTATRRSSSARLSGPGPASPPSRTSGSAAGTARSFVLNTLREGLPQPALKNQFPGDLIELLGKTDPNLVRSATQGIPAELLSLFERLTRP
jgi:hypothetical protein